MQLLAKFEKILYLEFRANLNFRKFKVALNSMFRFSFPYDVKLRLLAHSRSLS